MIKGDGPHRKFAGRVRQVIADFTREGTVTALGREAEERYPKLASKVRNWIPPIERWQWNAETEKWRPAPELSQRAKSDDWSNLRFPQADSLYEFCELTNASPTHLLLGEGPRYRSDSRTDEEFTSELTNRVRRRLEKKGVELNLFEVGIAPRIAEIVSDCVQHELKNLQRIYELKAIGFEFPDKLDPRNFL